MSDAFVEVPGQNVRDVNACILTFDGKCLKPLNNLLRCFVFPVNIKRPEAIQDFIEGLRYDFHSLPHNQVFLNGAALNTFMGSEVVAMRSGINAYVSFVPTEQLFEFR